MPTQEAELSSEIYQNPTSLCSASYRLVGAARVMLDKLIDLSARHPITVISLLAVLVRVSFVIFPAFFVGLDSGDTAMVEYLSIMSRTLPSDEDRMVNLPSVSLSSIALATSANSVLDASWILSSER